MESHLETVRSFWNTEACGSHFVSAPAGTPAFYEQYRKFRYETEWHIPEWIPFERARGREVLEIGCGNGADGVLFARAGATYTGVDLTPAAVEATRRHFECLGLHGTFRTENAEALSFPDAAFDWVYSYGVLHHTANPLRAFREVARVLRPGGRAFLMLYHKRSFNYTVRILGAMRLKLLLKILFRAGRWGRDRRCLTGELRGVRGNDSRAALGIHYAQFLKEGWKYLRAENFVHHCTDGPECPYAFVYTKNEIREIMGKLGFTRIETRVCHFPLRKYRWGRRVPKKTETFLARHLGWYLCLSLKK